MKRRRLIKPGRPVWHMYAVGFVMRGGRPVWFAEWRLRKYEIAYVGSAAWCGLA